MTFAFPSTTDLVDRRPLASSLSEGPRHDLLGHVLIEARQKERFTPVLDWLCPY